MDVKTIYFIDDAQVEERSSCKGDYTLLCQRRRWDPALSSLGHRQARMSALNLAKRLGPDCELVDCIYAAPTLASLQTAAEFAAVFDVPIQPVVALGAAIEQDDIADHPYIHYDSMAEAVNPDGMIEVLPPIDDFVTYTDACLSLAEGYIQSCGIIVANRETVQDPLEACMIVETSFTLDGESPGYAVVESYLAHSFF